MTELEELTRIRQILEAIASQNGAIIERLPIASKEAIILKETEIKEVEK